MNQRPTFPFWSQTDQNVLQHVASSKSGLSPKDAADRLERDGLNEFPRGEGRSSFEIIKEQMISPMVVLLIVAAVVSWLIGEMTDSIVILTIVLLNAGLGFYQDYRAERALEALASYARPFARVKRDGTWLQIPSREIVVGDFVNLEAGDLVPADCRILQAVALETEEAALTGESTPITKQSEPVAEKSGLADRNSMLFLGSAITRGHGEAVVVATAMGTELGKIASLIKGLDRAPTPLQQRLSKIGRDLALFAIGIVGIIVGLGLWQGQDLKTLFLTGLSLAVAVVPEGLPAVATVSLALGARKMFARKALIRKLPAVETLGSVTVIGSDKTGTLTENKMSVTNLWVAGKAIDLQEGHSLEPGERDLLTFGVLCNNAIVNPDEKGGDLQGEPTEKALLTAALEAGISYSQVTRDLPRCGELPFDSERKRMTTVHRSSSQLNLPAFASNEPESLLTICKGAIDRVLLASDSWISDQGPAPLTPEIRNQIEQAHEAMAGSGRRVLAVAAALRPAASIVDLKDPDKVEKGLVFVGMWGMLDPPRKDAAAAVRQCQEAGIRPIMITGDHPQTAKAVAQQIGLADADSLVVTGADLDAAADQDWARIVGETQVFARVSPQHKLRIVETLQQCGEIVAMTGDGVNDAPALKRAQIGVAMGLVGSEVAKESAEMVLLDDSFSTIVAAVSEGRRVYDNIRKFLRYTLTSNMGEIGVMLVSPLFGLPLPLTPIQILWTNLVTDGLPGLALAVEAGESGHMKRPPHDRNESFLSRGMGLDILWVGALMSVLCWSAGILSTYGADEDIAYWRSMIFTVLTLSQLGNALSIRSEKENFWQVGLFSNHLMTYTVIGTLALQIAILYVPYLQSWLGTKALHPTDLGICFVLSTGVFVAGELVKFVRRKTLLPN